ncbi:hypothetical protein [Streptomyces sp. NBC_01803]|uniref:hypothetical protein n=1 Tax=Streptomyces sp. NBC_01803 TaxID=2975946 RepID=UPI002DDBF9F6|nr:hypothetical protein [Streptomyces sp. NBC_01803]WSA45445.1 hypothetical protein OIE51_15280 [Streptomyces sp. NBC_01803]
MTLLDIRCGSGPRSRAAVAWSSAGTGALVSDLLSALAAEAEFHRPGIGDRLAPRVVDLLAVPVMELCHAETEEETAEKTADAPTAGTETLARIRTFSEEHLTDPDPAPDPSPESIARAHRAR